MPNPQRRKTDRRYALGRAGKLYEAAKAACFARESECHAAVCLCPTGRTVDMNLPYRDPVTGKVNRWAKSFGHTDELDRPYTNPYDGHLEHNACNTSAGAAYGNKKRAGTLPGRFDTSHDWS